MRTPRGGHFTVSLGLDGSSAIRTTPHGTGPPKEESPTQESFDFGRVIYGLNLFVLGTSEQVFASYHIRMSFTAARAAMKPNPRPILPRNVPARRARLRSVGGIHEFDRSLDRKSPMKGPIGKSLLTPTPTKIEILDHEGMLGVGGYEFVGDFSRGGFDEARELRFESGKSLGVFSESLPLAIGSDISNLPVKAVELWF